MKTKFYKYMTIALVFVLGAFAATAVIAYASPLDSGASNWGNPPTGDTTYGPGMMNSPRGQYNMDAQAGAYCDGTGDGSYITDLPKEDLTAAESDLLVFMFEEEKMARDVYTALGETWNGGVFDMIAQAEQQHMDSVKLLLDKYEISVEELPAGEFSNNELQSLYDSLVAQGSESLAEAYKVGALVEETDIRDLIDSAKVVDNQDIEFVFDRLEQGSTHHLNAFVRNISVATGEEYVPTVLTQAEYDAILADGMGGRGSMGGRSGRGTMNDNFSGRMGGRR